MHKIPPPIYALAGIILEYGLDRTLALLRFDAGIGRLAALVFGTASLALASWAIGSFFVRRTTVVPHGTPRALVVEGPYRFTRNPMYLSLVLFLIAGGLWLGSVSPFVVPVLAVWIYTRSFIEAEEKTMAARFGAAYADYTKRVRRWL